MKQILAPQQHKRYLDAESIREQERQRIARDLHDELGQQLLVLRMDMAKLCNNGIEPPPNIQGTVDLLFKQIGTAIQSLRDVIRNLRPAALDQGLHAAMESQCKEFTQRFGIVCNLAWNARDIDLPERLAIALFRILQEALSNVQRHAQARRVCVIVSLGHNDISMTVIDDGVGVTFGNHAKARSYGLTGMRERVIALGGKLNICSMADQGMSLAISLPI